MALRPAVLLLCLAGGVATADDRSAEVNYMLHCQGCHLPDARGVAGRVPPMKDFAGWFLHSDEGRDFLIRVPGVAQSALTSDEVAELMNWLVTTFSAAQLPEPFVPFTAAEVAGLRVNPVGNPASAREVILANLASRLPGLRDALDGME